MKQNRTLVIAACIIVLMLSTTISTVIIVQLTKSAQKQDTKKHGYVTFQITHAIALCKERINKQFKSELISLNFSDLSNHYIERKNLYMLFAEVVIQKDSSLNELNVNCNVSADSYKVVYFKVNMTE